MKRRRYMPCRCRQTAWCLFLDVDGTLLELADHPGAVVVERRCWPLLERLRACRRRRAGAGQRPDHRRSRPAVRRRSDLPARGHARLRAARRARRAARRAGGARAARRCARAASQRLAARHPGPAARGQGRGTGAAFPAGAASSSTSCAPRWRCSRRRWCRSSRCSTGTR